MTNEPGGIVIHLDQGHDSKYGNERIASVPENEVGVIDRGLFSLAIHWIQYRLNPVNRYLIVRAKNNDNLKMLDNGNFLTGRS